MGEALRGIKALALLVAAASLLIISGCGSDDSDTTTTQVQKKTHATLVLDYLPNAVHAGIYRALAADYYKDSNIDLKVIKPTSTAATLKAIDSGQADFGIADAIDVASQINSGRPAKAVMVIVQRPLGGLIALKKSGIDTPKELEGKTVGITGVPSDKAVLDSIVQGDGGDPKRVKTVTIGFNGVTDLENEKIDAFTGFWPADGTQVQVDGYPTTIFKLDEFRGPRYPGLVVFTTEKKLKENPELVRAFLAATVKGYQETVKKPSVALNDLLKENPELKRTLASAQLKAYLPLFTPAGGEVGELQPSTLSTDRIGSFLAFLEEHKLIDKKITSQRFGTDEYLPKPGNEQLPNSSE